MPQTNGHILMYDLMNMAQHNRDGNFKTQHQRRVMLKMFARQLHALGYRKLRAHDFGQRHWNKLVALWKSQGIADRTIPNRLAALRWWAEKIGKPHIMPRTNAYFALAPRTSTAHSSKAKTVTSDMLAQMTDPYVRWSVQLQQAFGLRREESIKIRVWQADKGTHLALQASWCKGGRPREIPIRTAAQRELVDQIKAWVPTKTSALIPPDLKYIDQERRYDYQTQMVGLTNPHGLRHGYAQQRLEEEAGYPAPVNGGPSRKTMTPDQRALDDAARLTVSAELGHGRKQIVSTYTGT